MSSFLTQDDYQPIIREAVIGKIIQEDPTILDEAETMAQSEMTSYLSSRFDMDAIFSAQGASRNPSIVMRMVDITIYHIWSRTAARQISQIRVDRYNRAVEWMEKCVSGELAPDLPLRQDEEGNTVDRIAFGSNEKNSHIW